MAGAGWNAPATDFVIGRLTGSSGSAVVIDAAVVSEPGIGQAEKGQWRARRSPCPLKRRQPWRARPAARFNGSTVMALFSGGLAVDAGLGPGPCRFGVQRR